MSSRPHPDRPPRERRLLRRRGFPVARFGAVLVLVNLASAGRGMERVLHDRGGTPDSVTVVTIPDEIDARVGHDPPHQTRHRMLTYHDLSPVSPNGRWIVYTRASRGLSNDQGRFTVPKEVVVREITPADPERPVQHQLHSHDVDAHWDRHQMSRTMWAADDRIIFWRHRLAGETANVTMVYENTEPDGGGQWRYARHSPDDLIPEHQHGNWILCVNHASSREVTEIWEYNAASGETRRTVWPALLAAWNRDLDGPVHGFAANLTVTDWRLGSHPMYSRSGRFIYFTVSTGPAVPAALFLYDRIGLAVRQLSLGWRPFHPVFMGDDRLLAVDRDDGYAIVIADLIAPFTRRYAVPPGAYHYPDRRNHHAPNHPTVIERCGVIVSDAQYSVTGGNKYLRLYYMPNPGDDPVAVHLVDYGNNTSGNVQQHAHPALAVSGPEDESIRVFFNYDRPPGDGQCVTAYVDLRAEFAAGHWLAANRGVPGAHVAPIPAAGSPVAAVDGDQDPETSRRIQLELAGFDRDGKRVHRMRHSLSGGYLGVDRAADNEALRLKARYRAHDRHLHWRIVSAAGDDTAAYRIESYADPDFSLTVGVAADGRPGTVLSRTAASPAFLWDLHPRAAR